MRKKIEAFGHVWKDGDKYLYCYTDANDLNQHSKPFSDLGDCSQEFAQKFAEFIVRTMNNSINE